MNRIRMSRRMAWPAAALAALFGLTAKAEDQPAREVKFVLVNNMLSTPAFVALENGYWAAQGLDVKLKLTSSGRQVTQALQAGEAQLGHAALSTTTASARAGGNLIKGVMPYYNAAEYIAKAGGRARMRHNEARGDPAGRQPLAQRIAPHGPGPRGMMRRRISRMTTLLSRSPSPCRTQASSSSALTRVSGSSWPRLPAWSSMSRTSFRV